MARMTTLLGRGLATLATAVATVILIVAAAVALFLMPPWISFEQGRTGALELTGFTRAELDAATGEVLRNLVFGGDFVIETSSGERLLNDRERGHMQDVREVFGAFALVAFAAAAVLVASYAGARRLGHPERFWGAVRGGALVLAVAVVAAAVVVLVAFDVAFEMFHRIFFAGGTYLFDPQTERLVQLFPFAFWSETTMAVGAVVFLLSAAVAVIAWRRLRAARAEARSRSAPAAEARGAASSEAAG